MSNSEQSTTDIDEVARGAGDESAVMATSAAAEAPAGAGQSAHAATTPGAGAGQGVAAPAPSAALPSAESAPASTREAPASPPPLPLSVKAAAGLRSTLKLIEAHPVRAVGVAVAAGALVEVEFALGLLLGAGVTVMLATRSGPEARRELSARVEQLARKAKTLLARVKQPTSAAAPRA